MKSHQNHDSASSAGRRGRRSSDKPPKQTTLDIRYDARHGRYSTEVPTAVAYRDGDGERDGAKLYLVMERVYPGPSQEAWIRYRSAADQLAKAILSVDGEPRLQSDSIKKTMTGIGGGCAGFGLEHRVSDRQGERYFVTYASSKPVGERFEKKGKPKNPVDAEDLPELETRFRELYGDIVMSVGVSLWQGYHCFESRGIFRNPVSALDRTFPGISLHLHAFTATVVQQYIDPHAQYLFVNATANMATVIHRSRLGGPSGAMVLGRGSWMGICGFWDRAITS